MTNKRSQQDDGSGIMILSMTGYGRESVQTDTFSVTVELKSVNHRYSEISVYLPRPFIVYEEKIRRLLAKSIQRGKVDVYISVEGTGLYNKGLEIDWSLLGDYIKGLREAENRFSLSGELSSADLLRIDDAFSVREKRGGTEDLEDLLLQTVRGALDQLIEMRINEGRHLYGDLQQRLELIKVSVNKLKEAAPKVAAAYRSRLQKRIEAFLEGKVGMDEARMMNEVALFSEKADITEELTRLESHVGQFRKYMESGKAAGKKLNFLQQEMNREINTIGAKGNDFDISVQVVEMKSELEKIKEQIQNIE